MVSLTAQGPYKLATRGAVVAAFAAALLPLVMALIVVTAVPSEAQHGEGTLGNPGVIPPDAIAYGKSYDEWSIGWWQWALSLPATHHPLTDSADCSTGQTEKVWYLGGKFCQTGGTCSFTVPHRTCTVPPGTPLFFPLLNSECSTAEGNGTTYAELSSCAAIPPGSVTLTCTLDGKPVHNLTSYRVTTPALFQFTLASHDNILAFIGETVGTPPLPIPNGVTTNAAGDGYYLLLAPLSHGAHTIHFTGTVGGFSLDITYNLTVQ